MSTTWRGAPSEAQTSGPRFAARSMLLEKLFAATSPGRALDIGCGRGAITRLLAKRAEHVVATEVAGQAVEAASQALSDCANVSVRLANIFDGGGDDLSSEGPFDLVLLSEVLEHLDDDMDALRTVHGLLTDEGILTITVPRDPEFWSIEDELWGHRRRYTREELSLKLREAGFEVVTLWSWGFPLIKEVVRYQVSRLHPPDQHENDGTPAGLRPPSLLLPLARTIFKLVAWFEQLFKSSDRGIGYVVLARKTRWPAG